MTFETDVFVANGWKLLVRYSTVLLLSGLELSHGNRRRYATLDGVLRVD